MTEVDGALQAVAVLKTGGRGQLEPLIKEDKESNTQEHQDTPVCPASLKPKK